MSKTKKDSIITIHTDGSYIPTTNVGSWCAHIDTQDKKFFICGKEKNTTNNRMELLAVIEAIEYFDNKKPKVFHIYSDSRYVVDPIEKCWIYYWNNSNWKSKAKEEIKNIDLWKRFLALLKKHTIKLFWIKGHSGIDLNEHCDKLAKFISTKVNNYP